MLKFKIDRMVRFISLMSFLVFSLSVFSQTKKADFNHLLNPVRNYQVYQTISEMEIDGIPNESSWQKAAWSEVFEDIEGDTKPQPLYQTRFKMLWDKNNLYILAELEEPHIWCYYTTHDQIVYHENDFEIFIDPDRDTHNYYEFEINAQNTLFDLFMPKPYRNGGHALIDWNIEGFKSAVWVDGTLNNPNDTDRKWTLEIAIPFRSLSNSDEFIMPENGSFWKINFSRVQWQTEIVEEIYQKVKDKTTNKYLSENNWVWSPQGLVNMHYPERWGLAQFSKEKVGEKTLDFIQPEEEIFGKQLWLLYYKQHQYKRENGKFAASLSELEIQSSTKTENGIINYDMQVNDKQFTVYLQNEKGLKLSVNQDGLFKVITN